MDGMIADFKQAARALGAHRGYAAMAALTLALGIGANAAVFNLANWLIFRPLPGVRAQDRLVAIGFGSPEGVRVGISVIDLDTLRAASPGLEALAGYQRFALHVAPAGGSPERIDAEVVTSKYFAVLDGAIARGRAFSADEGTNPGASPVAIISHRLWTREFGGACGRGGTNRCCEQPSVHDRWRHRPRIPRRQPHGRHRPVGADCAASLGNSAVRPHALVQPAVAAALRHCRPAARSGECGHRRRAARNRASRDQRGKSHRFADGEISFRRAVGSGVTAVGPRPADPLDCSAPRHRRPAARPDLRQRRQPDARARDGAAQ